MAGKRILSLLITSSADNKGFRKATREIGKFQAFAKSANAKMKGLGAGVGSFAGKIGSAVAPVAKLAAVAGTAVVGVGGLAAPLAAAGAAAAAALGPMLALGAAMAPAALGGAVGLLATLKLAFKGVGDALAAANPEEFAEAIKDMGPDTQAGVTALKGLKDRFDDLGRTVQDTFFANWDNIGDLSALLAPLGDMLTYIAGQAGMAAARFTAWTSTGDGFAAMSQLMAESGKIAGDLAWAAQGILQGFVSVGAAAAPILAGLTSSMAAAAEQWGADMSAAFADGSLTTYLTDAMDKARGLFDFLGQVGGIISGVFGAAADAGAPFLGGLGEAIRLTNEWVNSVQGQTALGDFFTSMSEAVAAVMPVLGQLATIIGSTIAPVIADLITTIAPVAGTLVDAFGGVLEAIAPLFGPLGEIVALVGETLAGAIQAVTPFLTELAEMLAGALGDALVALQPLMPVIIDAFVQLMAGLQPLLPVFGDLIAAVVELIPPIVELITACLPPLVDIITSGVLPVVVGLLKGFMDLLGGIQPLIPIIGTVLAGALTLIAGLFKLLAPAIEWVVRIAVNLFGVLGGGVGAVSKITGVFKTMKSALSTLVGWLKKAWEWVANLIDMVAKFNPGKWFGKIFGEAPEGLNLEYSPHLQAAAGDPLGFLGGTATTVAPVTAVNVTVNVQGAVVADELALAEVVTNALKRHNLVTGRTPAVVR